MINNQLYLDLIDQNYPLRCRRSELLQARAERIVLQLETSVGEVVAKINTAPAQSAARIEQDLHFLNYVTTFGLNCPTLIKTADDQIWVKTPDCILYLLYFLPGRHPQASPHYFERAGDLLGRLHQLPIDDFAYRSEFTLSGELDYIQKQVAAVEHWPDDHLSSQLQETLLRLANHQPGRQTLIHTDFFSDNLIMHPNGDLYLIDLDDAGSGDPLLDLGYFIGHELIHPSAGAMTCTQADLEQFFPAYLRHRPLLTTELDLLPDYIYFGIMLYMCDPLQKRVALSDVERFRWLLNHEAWLRQSLKTYQTK